MHRVALASSALSISRLRYVMGGQKPCRSQPITRAAPSRATRISKAAGENYIAVSGLPFVSLRLASVLGPRLAIGAIRLHSRLKAGKSVFCTTAVRDFLDIADLLSFMDRAMDSSTPSGIFNLGPGVGHSITDVLTAVAKATGTNLTSPVDVRPVSADDVETVVLDPSATIAAFGWRHTIGLR